MQRRGDDSIRARIARARARARGGSRPAPVRPPTPKRRVPRREIQARRQRMVRWGVAAAGLLALIVLAGGLLYEYVIKPNQTAGHGWIGDDLPPGLLEIASDRPLRTGSAVPGFRAVRRAGPTRPVPRARPAIAGPAPRRFGAAPTSIQPRCEKMVDDQLYLQGMDDLGLDMTEDEIHTFALNRFAPPGAPLIAPSPTATLTAERAAMATSTAASLFATPLASPVAATPMSGTPVAGTPAARRSGLADTRDTRRHAAGRSFPRRRRPRRIPRRRVPPPRRDLPSLRIRSSRWRTFRRRTTSGWWPRPRWPVRKSAMRSRRLSGRARRRCARRISSFRRGRRPRPLAPG